MTDRHDDESWAPEDDELVRRALMSLMDDVSEEPLPEPAQIRARAEGLAEDGQVVQLDARRRRRKAMTVLAGAAAAALVATGAGLLVINQSPDTPVATSTTGQPTSTSSASSTAAPSRLVALGPAEWQAVLGVPVASTAPGEPSAHCFQPVDGTTWQSRSARQADTSSIAGQWVGTSPEGTGPLTTSVDEAVTDCEGYTRDRSIDDTLPSGGTFRAWHNTDTDGESVWWVEVSDGTSASFLVLPEAADRTFSDTDVRTLARGVLGEVDLTQSSPSTTSSGTSSPGTTSAPSTSTTTESAPTTPSGSSTSGSATTRPTPPPNTPTPPDTSKPVVGEIPSSAFVDPSRWSSQVLTGGRPATGGTLELEGEITIDPCASTDGATKIGGLGIRSGSGPDTFFGRQYILRTDTSSESDQMMSTFIGMYSTDCSGSADTRSIGDSPIATFALVEGDLTTYVAVVRQSPTSITILHLTTAKTAPAPLTDSTAASELERLAGLARG